MTEKDAKIAGLEKAINYTFRDRDLVWEALQMPGSMVRAAGARPIPDGNKRLAAIGDAVMEVVLRGRWYEQGFARGR